MRLRDAEMNFDVRGSLLDEAAAPERLSILRT